MSKPKNKSNKNQNSSGLQAQIQEQKRQILEHNFTIRQLQDRLSRMTQQNHYIVSNKDTVEQNYQEKVDKQRIIIESHQNTIKQLRSKVYDLEINKLGLQNKLRDTQREIRELQLVRNREMQEYKKLTNNDINKLQSQLKEYNQYMSERDQMDKDRSSLKKKLEDQKNDKIRQIADKQRQKVQATDKLRDEMLHKIREMRSNLLSLKKEQLSTTTRLAVLQNHQLTSQLEFQSKQTEKLLFENQQMQKKISNLQKDLEVHKQVEDQLAKRSHFSRGIIKKLTTKISQLQNELQQFKKAPVSKHENNQVENQKSSMLQALDRSLEINQKKYIKLQTDYEAKGLQNEQLKAKLQRYQKQSNTLISLLYTYYDDLFNGQVQVKDENYSYDLRSMKKRKIEDWSKQQIKMIVTILLNQLSTKLNRKNLGIPNINKSNLLVLDDDQESKLPRISQSSILLKKIGLEKKKTQQLPPNIASKIVGSNLREWGRTVHANSISHISRKFKISDK